MPNIEEMQRKMTLFYSKQTKEIKCVATGIQDINYFGENKVDFEIIYDYLVVDKDDYIFENTSLFKVEGNRVILKEPPKEIDYSKYI
ncbi:MULTISPECIES: hypothetical protein [Clostridium]|uniref:hypothetical protein n=1 Tax=Clostridium TaxID=1485 RepID=UPI0018997D5C|nr:MULTISPECIES: hypothetical protein [Clostridium]MDB2122393.1 hypothetical protein [Clostridium paraputrificum]MDU3677774.1 hypothetical protein [Clostridium sp.]